MICCFAAVRIEFVLLMIHDRTEIHEGLLRGWRVPQKSS